MNRDAELQQAFEALSTTITQKKIECDFDVGEAGKTLLLRFMAKPEVMLEVLDAIKE